jgi:hypothetical protein
MRQSRFCEEKIIAILAEQERSMGTAEVCRKYGISPAHRIAATRLPSKMYQSMAAVCLAGVAREFARKYSSAK